MRSANTAALGDAASLGPPDGENLMRINSSSRLLTWNYDASKIIPSLIKDWEINEGPHHVHAPSAPRRQVV